MYTFPSAPSASSVRTPRPRTFRRLAGAAAAALAALVLTACQDGTGFKDGGAAATPDPASAPASAAPTAPATPATPADPATPAASAAPVTSAPGSAKNSAAPARSAEGGRVLCNGSNTAVTVQPVSRPLNHMLITVKNTGSKTCDLTYYPLLRFDEMQWAPAAREETKPQAVVSLAPGRSGYAAALLSAADGSGEGGTTGHRLTIAFQGPTPRSDGGASATPSLPAAGVHYDSALTVTYWQQTGEDALGS
ncbi:DUF4232 domain-containing protein [Streptomyces spororaveus]|uniref:DUF4232 domain-containing protein n=1 Tax=Streptomyces spororaveus TaxID=284039 RepID=A0ABQ3T575_9ACTN|nr:DUF4232 domain-containing protein [Streptomyces spororaveus]MCM9076660.1 DUF4232 domain-containing protein [Streptomyces spororaveus]GHI75539.1 hypothetical protein Sspor_11000 [Streptomyces spororaveus]